MKLAIALVALLSLMTGARAIPPGQLQLSDSWLIEGPAGEKRWVEIHRSADETEIMHISIISRKIGAEQWEITRVVPHLAITTEALCQSVIKPAKEKTRVPRGFRGSLRPMEDRPRTRRRRRLLDPSFRIPRRS